MIFARASSLGPRCARLRVQTGTASGVFVAVHSTCSCAKLAKCRCNHRVTDRQTNRQTDRQADRHNNYRKKRPCLCNLITNIHGMYVCMHIIVYIYIHTHAVLYILYVCRHTYIHTCIYTHNTSTRCSFCVSIAPCPGPSFVCLLALAPKTRSGLELK